MKKATISSKKVLLLVAFVLSFSSIAKPAQAVILPVFDGGNIIPNTLSSINTASSLTKEWVLDTLAYTAANVAIESMTKSMVNWINSGFQGSPAFVTDLNQNLRGVGDAVAAKFFEELSMQTVAKTPFQDRILDSLRLGYYLRTSPESFYTRYPYTLYQVSSNPDAFLAGDFSQGGWDAWFATVVNPQNNPYHAQELASQALSDAIYSATGNRLQELSWNRGFLSWRGKCSQEVGGIEGSLMKLSDKDPCLAYEINTPGSVIMEQLNTQFGAGVNRLVSADEFNEVIGALLNQLTKQIMGGNNDGGLRGLSRPATGGGSSFIADPGNSSGATNNTTPMLVSTLSKQRKGIEDFQKSWNTIRTAALAARDACQSRSDTERTQHAQEALDYSQIMLVKAVNALTTLSGFEQRLAAADSAGGNQTLAIQAIAEEYNTFSVSNEVPSAQEIAETQIAVMDTGDTEPGSLLKQLVRNSLQCSLPRGR